MKNVLIIGDRVIFFDHVTRIKFDPRSHAAFIHFSDGEQWEFNEDDADAIRKYIGDRVIASGGASATKQQVKSSPTRA